LIPFSEAFANFFNQTKIPRKAFQSSKYPHETPRLFLEIFDKSRMNGQNQELCSFTRQKLENSHDDDISFSALEIPFDSSTNKSLFFPTDSKSIV
jgi:hypothetical protein